MKYSDSFANASNFVRSMVQHPKQTLIDTLHGIETGVSHLEGFDKFAIPAFGVLGAFLLVTGAATQDPMAMGLGSFEISNAGGAYMDIGQHLTPPPPPGVV
ncbi:MAG: hypothetical protein DI551_05395 [Micavibrio aeruginosavorus]|uniref:Uncharacterized protein n=1 Tax=Micavibrio aeruginosavorus TaxID=349221 RepID=A0A2W5MYC4_9BACT|nr:MAG: hypothetical protein DI551_05395 [Micavibrio aeruginosavorus]